MAMAFQLKENSSLVALNCEELDYEGDDIGFKKNSPVAVEQEEGEISDLEDDDDNLENLTCFFFQRGKCSLGSNCPLLHVTDKGLYRMLDSPSSSVTPTFYNVVSNTSLYISEPQETALTDWDRALKEAKKRVKQSDSKLKPACPITVTIESDDDQSHLKKKTGLCKLPISKVLSGDSSHSFTFSRTLKQEQLAKENKQPREILWHDPCRRLSYERQKKSSISSNSRSDSQSPHRRKRTRLSLSEQYNRGNQNRSISCLSSSRSRSPHLTKEQMLKAKCTVQEKKSRSLGKKDQQPIISRRSSRSRSPALLRRSREERPKQKYHSVENKPLSSSKDSNSSKRRIAVLFSKSSDQQPTVACRSLRLRSPASVRCPREQKHKIPTKSQTTIPERKSHSLDNKSNRNSKDFIRKRTASLFSNFDKQLKMSHPVSSKSHSPTSLCRSKDEKLKIKKKGESGIPGRKSHSFKNKPERNSKDHDYTKETRIAFSFDRQPRDVGRRTPKNSRPPLSPVRNCSDMSISPLTDSSLSDLFDPDKKSDRMGKPRWYEATQSRLFPPQKMDKIKIYGPVCPQEIHSAILKSSQMKLNPEHNKSLSSDKKTDRINVPYCYIATQPRLFPPHKIGGPVCTSELKSLQTKSSPEQMIATKDCVTQKKPIGPSTSKQVQKRNISALESDLLKFHKHCPRLDASQPAAAQQKMTERRESKKASAKVQSKSVQRKPLSRKEELLQQLAKINEVIEKKRKMCAKMDDSL